MNSLHLLDCLHLCFDLFIHLFATAPRTPPHIVTSLESAINFSTPPRINLQRQNSLARTLLGLTWILPGELGVCGHPPPSRTVLDPPAPFSYLHHCTIVELCRCLPIIPARILSYQKMIFLQREEILDNAFAQHFPSGNSPLAASRVRQKITSIQITSNR